MRGSRCSSSDEAVLMFVRTGGGLRPLLRRADDATAASASAGALSHAWAASASSVSPATARLSTSVSGSAVSAEARRMTPAGVSAGASTRSCGR